MSAQAIQFFGDVAFLREHDHFLLQALRVHLGLHVGETVEDFLALGGEHLRDQFAQGHHVFFNGRQAIVDQPCQLRAFALAASLEFFQAFVEQRQCFGVQGLRVGRITHQHAGPGQDFERIQCGRILDQAGDRLGGGNQLCGAVLIHLQRFAGVFFGEAQGAFELAPRYALAQGFTDGAFEVAKGVRQAQVGFQVAAVDRAQFPAQGALDAGFFDAGEGGHAVHHGGTSQGRSAQNQGSGNPISMN
ncbi:hypothetical protein D3C73_1116610 [compost metagenome]